MNSARLQDVCRAGGIDHLDLHVHDRIDPATFERCGFDAVNPWSGDAGRSLARRLADRSFRANLAESTVIHRLRVARRRLTRASTFQCTIDDQQTARNPRGTNQLSGRYAASVVLHRDPKPSNFIERSYGRMFLIDFDTIGIGAREHGLGELLRALVTNDESTTSAVCSGEDCVQIVRDLASGYREPAIDADRLRSAGCRCCLWQRERFFAVYLAGDRYHRIDRRGNNCRRAQTQLDGFDRLAGGLSNSPEPMTPIG